MSRNFFFYIKLSTYVMKITHSEKLFKLFLTFKKSSCSKNILKEYTEFITIHSMHCMEKKYWQHSADFKCKYYELSSKAQIC